MPNHNTKKSFGVLVLQGFVRFWSGAISPYTLPACRFQPTCSQYAYQALQEHGAVKGSWLTVCRLGRCNPFGAYGYDPVPTTETIIEKTPTS